MAKLRLEIDPAARGRRSDLTFRDEAGTVVLTDCRDLMSCEERDKAARELSEKLQRRGFERTKDQVLAQLEKSWFGHVQERERERAAEAAAKAAAEAAKAAGDEDPEAPGRRLLDETPKAVLAEAEALLRHPDLFDRVSDDIAARGVAGERDLAATLYLTYTSRKLERPLSARVRGPSTSGKSHLIDSVAELMPPEAVIRASQMTPNSLFYMEPGSLRQKLIVAGERSRKQDDEVAEATRALREMISAGRLSKLMVLKIDGRPVTKRVEQEGPISFVESTTLGPVFPEDENRALPLYTDETPAQTRRVIKAIAEAEEGKAGGRRAERILAVHHASQRMLLRYKVLVPFAGRLGELLSEDRVEVRRAFTAVLSMVEASALLHQAQRPCDREGRLIAQALDYRIAARLLAGPMGQILRGALPDSALRFWERLRGWFGDGQFTARAAKEKETIAPPSVRNWLRQLREAGLVREDEEGRGPKGAKLRLTDLDPGQARVRVLPDVAEVCGR
jgi:hypothetical protein